MARDPEKELWKDLCKMNHKRENGAIDLKQLSIGYQKGKDKLYVLKDLNTALLQGELVCLVGENGVGKSTLLRTISGVQPPLSGEVLIHQKPLHDFSSPDLAKTISLVLTDRIYAGNLSVRELVTLGRYPYTNWLGSLSPQDHEKINWSLEMTGTRYLEDQLISEISDGQFQKTLIARALAQDSDIIILDEPTAHLDLTNKIIILKLLKDLASKTGKAILMATHELELSLQIADQIWMAFKNDVLVSGSPEDLVLNGNFNRMVNHESIYFDQSNGRFLINSETTRSCTLTADKSEKIVYSLTRNALIRSGWDASTAGHDITVHISSQEGGYTWQVHHHKKSHTAHSIGDLLSILKQI